MTDRKALETELVANTRLHLSQGDVRLFRNNVGALQDKAGRWVAYGLCPGSSDLIGWRSIEITPEMVGRRVAVFAALEAKAPGERPTWKQHAFLRAVRLHGGLAGDYRSLDEAREILKGEQE